MKVANLDVYSTAGQAAAMLLAALRALSTATSKKETLDFIKSQKWFNLAEEDQKPYPSQPAEPRWRTLLAFARKNCVSHGLLEDDGVKDSWCATKDGLNAPILVKLAISKNELDIKRFYLWSYEFKTFMCPAYLPSEHDLPRPKTMYEDFLKPYQKSVRGNKVSRIIDKYDDLL